MIPPPGYSTDPAKWVKGPVLGLKEPVVDMSGSKHTSLQSMQVLFDLKLDTICLV
jgi:hypothetical protein